MRINAIRPNISFRSVERMTALAAIDNATNEQELTRAKVAIIQASQNKDYNVICKNGKWGVYRATTSPDWLDLSSKAPDKINNLEHAVIEAQNCKDAHYDYLLKKADDLALKDVLNLSE